jgi:hypothetical protein
VLRIVRLSYLLIIVPFGVLFVNFCDDISVSASVILFIRAIFFTRFVVATLLMHDILYHDISI